MADSGMGMNETPSANRVHIGIFGRRNAGKSSLINAITGQSLSIVSDRKGTTTDPVSKAMELLPLGPIVLIDTPGMDDEGELGGLRVEKTRQALRRCDLAVLVLDGPDAVSVAGQENFMQPERAWLESFRRQDIPYVLAVNKSEDLTPEDRTELTALLAAETHLVFVSAKTGQNIHALKESLAHLGKPKETEGKIVGDLLSPGEIAALVIPIDSAAPKGRLILPQQQVIRDCLEAGAIPVIARETEFSDALKSLAKTPKVVITDSQAFERVAKDTPSNCFLTSFSILFARYKGDLAQQVQGASAIRRLKDGDTVLISEGCTHHRQCEDIGTVKLPRQIAAFTQKKLEFRFTSGTQFPEDLSGYALIVHCGGCTLNGREMKYRLQCAKGQGIPMTNYGTAIAYMHGILERSLELFHGKL